MVLTANRIKEMWNISPTKLAGALAETLADFGYPVTADWVETEIERLYAGGKATGGPSMFIAKWLENGVED